MKKNLNAVIVDDEKDSLDAIYEQIKLYTPGVNVIGCFDDPLEGLQMIQKTNPDVIFLDIQMPKLNGLELARQLRALKTQIIFVTAYSQYAIDAIKLSALDYILKPIDDPEELIDAIKKVRQRLPERFALNQNNLPVLEKLITNEREEHYPQKTKIGLADDEGVLYVKVKNIIRLEAQKNYCEFFFLNDKSKIVSKNMGYYINSLKKYNLVQVHRGHVVNLNHVKKYVRREGPFLRMADGSEIPVSKHYLVNYEVLT